MAKRSGTYGLRGDDTKNVQSDSEILSDHLLLTVATNFGQEWEHVALSLKFKMNEVEQLKSDYKSVKDQATNMLIRWRNRRGREPGLIKELCLALTEQHRKDMADDLREQILQTRRTKEGRSNVDKEQEEEVRHDIEKEKATGRKDSDEIDDGETKGHPHRLDSHESNEEYDLLEILDIANEHFIETAALNRAEQILREKQIIFITGQNGSGKTSLAYHLYCTIAEEVDEEMFCGKLDDILENFEVDKNKVFFLDDVFGTLMVDNDAIDKWSTMMKDIAKFRRSQEDIGCLTYLIFCCRNEIMKNISAQIPVESVVDMSQESMEESDKRKFFKQIWKRHNAQVEMPSYIYNFDFPENSHLGFWFCADFHARRYHSHGKSFWEDPIDILSKKMKNCIEENTIPQQLFEKLSNQKGTALSKEPASSCFRLLASDISICRQFPEFFKLNVQECFEYQHALLHEQIELHLATKDVPKAIMNLSLKGLHKITVLLPKTGRARIAKNTRRDPLCLKTERDVCQLISRLMKEVNCGNVREVCKHTLWKDDRTAVLLDEHIFQKRPQDVVKGILTTTDKIYGENMLYWSTIVNRTKLCEILVHNLKNHIDIDDQQELLSRSLIGACSVKRNISIVDELIRKGANVSYCYACHLEKTPKVENENDLENKSEHSCPLDFAIENGSNNHAIQLLKNKAEIPHSTWADWKLLQEAANLEDELLRDPTFLKGLKLLFNSNINNEAFSHLETNKYHQFLLEIKDSCDDVHEIFLAFAKHGFLSCTMLQAFVNCNANINILNRSKENVLHLLIANEDDDTDEKCKVIQTLLRAGCDGDQKSKARETPLTMTFKRNSCKRQIVEELLKGNVSTTVVSKDGKTPLHNCVEDILEIEEAISVVSILLQFGCQDKPDKDGYTALDRIFDEDVLKIDLVTALTKTPLHACIESSKVSCSKKCEIVDQLITQGIDINGRDSCNHTPLSKAIAIGCDQNLIEYLLKVNADCSLAYSDTKSILQVLFSSQTCPTETMADAFVNSDACLRSGNVVAVIADGLKSSTSQFSTIMKIFTKYPSEVMKLSVFHDSDKRNLLHLCMTSSLEDNECLQLCERFLNNGLSAVEVDCRNNSAFDLAVNNEGIPRTKTIILMLDVRLSGQKGFNQKKFLNDLFISGQICVDILRAAMRKKLIDKSKKYKINLLHLLGKRGYVKKNCKTAKNVPVPDDERLEETSTIPQSSTHGVPSDDITSQVSTVQSQSDDGDKLLSVGTTMPDEILPEDSCKPIKSTFLGGNHEAECSELIDCLCACGFGINEKDNSGRTPLFLACCCEKPDIDLIKAFCNKCATVNEKDKEGRTPLHGCLSSKMDDNSSRLICEILVNNNAKVNKQDSKLRSPLLTALEQEINRSATVRFLLESCNAYKNVQDIKGDSCLHYCISRNVNDYEACVLLELLLEFNPDIECKNNLQLTPLNFAATYHTRSRILCMVYLLSKRINVNSIDSFGRTPLFNVLRCLGGNHVITYASLERIVRLALLFAFEADPTYQANEYQECYDTAVTEMMKDYPTINIDKLVSYISNKLANISKRHTQKDEFSPPFAFNVRDPKRKLYEMAIEASRYLTNVYFTELPAVDISDSNDDKDMQAQVAVMPHKYFLTP